MTLEMQEVLPGVRRWTAMHPRIGFEVSSHWVPASGAVIDPILPEGAGADDFKQERPDRVLLSNRHHLRDAEALAKELGCVIECSKAGLHEFEGGGPEVQGFD